MNDSFHPAESCAHSDVLPYTDLGPHQPFGVSVLASSLFSLSPPIQTCSLLFFPFKVYTIHSVLQDWLYQSEVGTE